MRVRFWGTRGSIPVSLTWRDVRDRLVQALMRANGQDLSTPEKAYAFAEKHLDFALTHTFGGHTSCVEFDPGADEYFVCDMGSGARAFGAHVLARQAGRPATVNIFMSHVHWDHILGFPFFGPAYSPQCRLRIYGCNDMVELAMRRQQDAPSFPVPFSQLAARIEFKTLEPGRAQEISGIEVTPWLQSHSGDSFGFRFRVGDKALVYSTDCEHKLGKEEVAAYREHFRDADLVIFDAMYSLADAVSVKADWGHSSNVIGVELCQLARAKRLALYHHEPANSDTAIEQIFRETLRFEELTRNGPALEVIAAYDGLEIDL